MRSNLAAGGVAAIVFGVAGLVATVLQISQQSLGFEDTDDPAVNLAFLRGHLDNYLQQGVAFMLMALALTIVVFALWDLLTGPYGSLGLRTVSTIGLASALCFFLFGVLRYGVRSVVGFGGLLTTGEFFAVVMFSKVEVPEESARRFRSIALDLKAILFSFAELPVFSQRD